MMDIVIACTVMVGLVALGDLVSKWTKALIPSMAVALILYMLLTWAGMPKSFPDTSGFSALGDYALLMLVVNIGTSVAPSEYVKNLKSVAVAIAAVVVGLIFTVGIGGLIFGFNTMLAGAGACCGGGCISGIATIGQLKELGLVGLLVVPTIMICTVDPLGQPIASNILKRYAKKLHDGDEYLNVNDATDAIQSEEVRLTKHGVPFGSEENPSTRFTNFIPVSYEEDGVILFELTVCVLISVGLEAVTGVNSFLWAFIVGIIGCEFGILRMNLLDRSHSNGLVMTIIIAYLCTTMNDVTPKLLLESFGPVITLVILSALGLGLGAGFMGKILGYDFILSAAAGVGIMFLYPGVAIVSTEVSKSYARNEEERNFIYNKIAPPMYIIANVGFLIGLGITVTVLLPMLK